jgi:hypothetical protein
MNTSEFIPYECVSPNILVLENHREYPGLYGTGFFVVYPPYRNIFYVTARHCVKDMIQPDSKCHLKIPIKIGSDRTVDFGFFLETNINSIEDEEREDIVVYVVASNIREDDFSVLYNRALKLKHQEDVDLILEYGVAHKEKMRTVGYPTHDHPNCLNQVDYENNRLNLQPRGFVGVLDQDQISPNYYMLVGTNWKEGEYRGFSGSPVIGLFPVDKAAKEVLVVPIGVILMASRDIARFININVVTNLIASYFLKQIEDQEIERIPELAPGQGAY